SWRQKVARIGAGLDTQMEIKYYLQEIKNYHMNSLAFAIRGLRRAPQLTAVAVITLALAIGSTTAVFSVVDAVVLHGLPYGNAGQFAASTSAATTASFASLRSRRSPT